MGFNVGSVYSGLNSARPVIDSQALAKVTEQILNPNNDKSVDVSKLDLSKFNRVSLGTDLYAAKTSSQTALQASKAATDFGVNFSQNFNANVQYLNSQAAQSLFTAKEINGKVVVAIDNLDPQIETKIVAATTQVAESKNMDKDKRGSNPFSFYAKTDGQAESEENESLVNSINIFA